MKTWKWQQRIIAHENKMTLVELAEATIFAAGVAGSDQLDSRDSWEADYLQSKLMERLAHIEKRLAEPPAPADEEREKALDELIPDGCPTVDDYWKNCLCTDCVAFREKRTLILAAPQKKVMPHDAKVTRKEREVILEKCGGDWTRCPLGEAEEDEVEGE